MKRKVSRSGGVEPAVLPLTSRASASRDIWPSRLTKLQSAVSGHLVSATKPTEAKGSTSGPGWKYVLWFFSPVVTSWTNSSFLYTATTITVITIVIIVVVVVMAMVITIVIMVAVVVMAMVITIAIMVVVVLVVMAMAIAIVIMVVVVVMAIVIIMQSWWWWWCWQWS